MPRLIALISELNFAYSRYVLASQKSALWQPRSNHDHWQIFDAYASNRYDVATTLLVSHINTVDRITMRIPQTIPGSGVGP